MTFAAWPGPPDFLGWLARFPGLEVTPGQAAAFAACLSSAQTELEQRTGRQFLAGAVAERRFDPPAGTGFLDLPDLATEPGVVYQPSGSTPTTWVTEEDYWIPVGALRSGTAPGDAAYDPITLLVLPSYWSPRPGSTGWGTLSGALRLTGSWGYGTVLPADVWEACCARAACLLWPALTYALPGGAGGPTSEQWTEGGEKGRRGTATYQSLAPYAAAWQGQVDAVVRRYRRLAF